MSEDQTKVISIKGDAIRDPGKPVEQVVTMLEEILEKAKSGNVIGVAISCACSDRTILTDMSGFFAHYTMVGGLMRLVTELSNEVIHLENSDTK